MLIAPITADLIKNVPIAGDNRYIYNIYKHFLILDKSSVFFKKMYKVFLSRKNHPINIFY